MSATTMRLPTTIRILLRELREHFHQFRNRVKMDEMGFRCARNSIINFPDATRIKVGRNCNLACLAVLDISDGPGDNEPNAQVLLGDYVYIGEQSNVRASGSTISIGSYTMIANNVIIVSSNHLSDRSKPMIFQEWEKHRRGVTIGEDCWIGSHSSILPGTRIGNGVIIAAGAVVRGDIPDYTVWGGVPARMLKSRS